MKFKQLAAIPAVSLMITNVATAETSPSNIYVGVDLGSMSVDYDTVGGIDYGNALADKLSTLSPYVGYNVNNNFAVEAGYMRSSEKSTNFDSGVIGLASGTNVESKIRLSGFYVDGVGKYAVSEKITALGSVGLARLKSDITLSAVSSAKASSSDTALRLGAGAEYAITEKVSLRGMARYMKVDFDDTVSNAMHYTIGANYKF